MCEGYEMMKVWDGIWCPELYVTLASYLTLCSNFSFLRNYISRYPWTCSGDLPFICNTNKINFKTDAFGNKSQSLKLLSYFAIIYLFLSCQCRYLLCLFHSNYSSLIICLSAWIWIKSKSFLKEVKIKIFLNKQTQTWR